MSLTNTGKSFETRLQTTFDAYRNLRVMDVRKVEPPCKIVGTGRFRKVIFLENPFLDFTGVWTERSGRSLHFEAKSTAGNSLSVGKTGGVTARQMDALRDWTNAGAIAGVLWECPAGVFYCGAGRANEIAIGRCALKPEFCHKLEAGKGYILYNIWKVLHEIY